jgi:AraC-like DNA-binding protein
MSNRQATESVSRQAWLGYAMKMMATSADGLTSVPRSCDRAEPVQIWKARRFIDEHSTEELSLTKVAQVANISANYLSEKFKQVTGVNFVDYVTRTRLKMACDLLENSDRRTSEIAFEVGFQSLSQFNRVFKKKLGKSPTAYRRRLPSGAQRGE